MRTNWYHNAPRALKNHLWALHDIPEAGAAVADPLFAPLLEGWALLTPDQKGVVLNTYHYLRKDRTAANAHSGGADALTAPDTKTRQTQ